VVFMQGKIVSMRRASTSSNKRECSTFEKSWMPSVPGRLRFAYFPFTPHRSALRTDLGAGGFREGEVNLPRRSFAR
jgi:hypothetical protein